MPHLRFELDGVAYEGDVSPVVATPTPTPTPNPTPNPNPTPAPDPAPAPGGNPFDNWTIGSLPLTAAGQPYGQALAEGASFDAEVVNNFAPDGKLKFDVFAGAGSVHPKSVFVTVNGVTTEVSGQGGVVPFDLGAGQNVVVNVKAGEVPAGRGKGTVVIAAYSA